MALQVIREQPEQAPWWVALATNTLVPMIGDALERQRQRDENRKMNNMLAEVLKAGNAGAELPTGNAGAGLPTGNAGAGLPVSSNGWENVYRATGDNPLANFDANMANLLPPSTQNTGAPQVTPTARQPLTQDQLIQNYINVLTNPRFSHLSFEEGLKRLQPYMTAAEATRMEGRRNEVADNYMNAMNTGDLVGGRNSVFEGALRGVTPESLANMANTMYVNDRPQFGAQDLGGSIAGYTVNPVTGEVTPKYSWDKSLTPQQVQAGQQWDKTYEANRIDADRNYEANRIDADRNYELNSRPKLAQVVRGDDGLQYMMFNDGSRQAINPDAVGLSIIEKERITGLENNRNALITQQTELMKALAKAQTDEERTNLLERLNNVTSQIKSIDDEVSSIYTEKIMATQAQGDTGGQPSLNGTPGVGDDIGSNMISHNNNGQISSPFGKERTKADGTKYTHNGIDLPVPEGTKILVPDVGTTLTVVRVDNQASGYGNYVDLEGNLNGHKIEMRVAHMKNGGVSVRRGDVLKYGDLIGLSGNTGNSRGKNGGYHMHLEMKIDGRYIDPTKAWEYLKPLIKNSSNPQNGNATQGNSQGAILGQEYGPPAAAGIISGAGTALNNIAATAAKPPIAATNLPTPSLASRMGSAIGSKFLVPGALAMITDMIWPKPAGEMPEELPNNNMNVDAISGAAPNVPQPTSTDIVPTSNDDVGLIPHPVSSDIPATPNVPISNDVPTSSETRVNTGTTTSTALNENSNGFRTVADTYYQNTPQIDPDGGLSSYRAEGDNTPVTWRNMNGEPMRTSDGQLFTQNIYDDWKRKADAGYFKDKGINNGADLDNWLRNAGMYPDRPSEERGINNLNGNSYRNANLPTESEDTNITPFNITPQTHPEQYPAPTFTDDINGSTPMDTENLLDSLNGIISTNSKQLAQLLRQLDPSTYAPEDNGFTPKPHTYYDELNNRAEGLARYLDTGDRYGLIGARDLLDRGEPASWELVANRRRRRNSPARRRAPVRRVAPAVSRSAVNGYKTHKTTVDGAAKRHGVDSELVRAIIQVESNWNSNARSKVGAMGLMQLIPKTVRGLGVKNAYDPAQNIAGGTKYIAQLIRQFGGDVSKALMAYNCGAGNVKRGRIPAESRRYAQKVLGIYNSLKGQR